MRIFGLFVFGLFSVLTVGLEMMFFPKTAVAGGCTVDPQVMENTAVVSNDLFTGTVEQKCVGLPDDTGKYEHVSCIKVNIDSVCGTPRDQDMLNTMRIDTYDRGGPYCYCRISQIEGYEMDSLTVQPAGDYAFLVHPSGQFCGGGSLPSCIAFSSQFECESLCQNTCLNWLQQDQSTILFFLVLLHQMGIKTVN